MVTWVIILAVLTIISYLTDVGVLSFMQLKIPFINASVMSMLILLCMIGMLGRLLWKAKRGEKEILAERIYKLEKELKTFSAKEKSK